MNVSRCIRKDASEAFACRIDWRSQKGHALPQDLLDEAAHRVGSVSLVYAVGYFVAYFGMGLTHWMQDDPTRFVFLDGRSQVAWAAIATAIGMFALTRVRRIPSEKILDLSLIFLVVGAAGISCSNFWGIFPHEWQPDLKRQVFFGVPWEAIWILIFPVMVPNCPFKTLLASLIAASVGPVTVTLSIWTGATGGELGPWFFWRYFLFTNYFCALLAWFSSAYIHKLGSVLRQARDVGSYTLGDKLGEGGMGEIYRAEHRLLARPAAIKVIRPHLLGADDEQRAAALARFQREAQATASLHSPHTIRLYDFGHTRDGSFYYVMELLEGISLERLVDRFGPQPPGRVIPLLRQICHSLQDAHVGGVIHRDIKPSNLVLCRMGQEYDFMKVLDFGLVKHSAGTDRAELEASLTQVGVTAGTPAYLSPETALSHPVDARSDLYSLACVAVFLLTGEPVFRGTTALETVAMHLKDEPVPPSQRSEFPVGEDLDAVLLACLAKDPAARPASAAELSQLLAACAIEREWDQDAARHWWEIHDPLPKNRETPDAGTSLRESDSGLL